MVYLYERHLGGLDLEKPGNKNIHQPRKEQEQKRERQLVSLFNGEKKVLIDSNEREESSFLTCRG